MVNKTDEYKKRVKELTNNEFEVISEYNGTDKPITILHKKCGEKFILQARSFIKSPFCRACKEKELDITGKTFNAWTVIEYDKSKYKWKCQCQCGTIRYMQSNALIDGISKSCGCSSWFNLIGVKIGRLNIKSFYDKQNGTRMLCDCDCGKENVIVSLGNLKSKNPTKSCGCLQDEYRHSQLEDLTGNTYGKWTVIEYIGDQMWSCKCECGTIKPVNSVSLKCGDSKSCGICTKQQIDETFFDIIDTEEKAYILGFFYADACHYEDIHRIKIDLQKLDEEILYKFKDALKFTGNILHYGAEIKKFKSNEGEYKEYQCQPYSRLSFSNKQLSEQLKLKGCIANKSKIIIFPTTDIVSINLQRHFIRGYFDGNGTIGYWVANKNTGWKKFNFGLCGTTEIINSIANILIKEFECTPDIRSRFPDRDNNNVQLALCGNRQISKIMRWLYADSTIYLQRKYEKYIILLQENKKIDKKGVNDLPSSCFPSKSVRDLRTNIVYNTVNETSKEIGISTGAVSWQCNKSKNPYLIYESNYEKLSNDDKIKLLHKFNKEAC